jgi:hypothetical protein
MRVTVLEGQAFGPENIRGGLPLHTKEQIMSLIPMKNPKTGEVKEVKVGWSWILFLFSGFFGLPLFLRKLTMWGGIFLAVCIVSLVASAGSSDGAQTLSGLMALVSFGLAIFMGVKGNEMTAKNYLEQGWSFVEPESELTRIAKVKWGIAI